MKKPHKDTVSIIGAGSWGIALALVLVENGNRVALCETLPVLYQKLVKEREEKDKLPGVKIPESIELSNEPEKVVSDSGVVVFAIPSQFLKSVIKALANVDFSDKVVVNVAKGIETTTLKRMSEILFESNPTISQKNYVMFSGPSHAEEVVKKMPTTIVAASKNSEAALQVQTIFNTGYLRVYTNDDVVGAELAGALKNVIAIAAGTLDGLGYGDNIKGALLTRGMVEITRLGMALGAKKETFFGLTGIGDLITTCISKHSRNRYVGEHLGQGEKIGDILQAMKMVAEGVETTRSAYQLAVKMNVEMPITEKMYNVLFNDANPAQSIKELMERGLKPEAL